MVCGRHASMLALFAFPTAPVCIAAGTSGTSRAAFFGADACATLLRAGVLLVLAFEPYTPSERLLEAVRSLAARHPATSLALTTTLATPGVLGALALLRRAWQASGSDAAASTPPHAVCLLVDSPRRDDSQICSRMHLRLARCDTITRLTPRSCAYY